MAKRGESKHVKRIAISKAIPITNKKESTWMIRSLPGPHPKKMSINLGVLVRDILKLAKTAAEVKKILNQRLVYVDNKIRTDPKFIVGLMDIVSFPKIEKHFRMVVDWKGRLVPIEVPKTEANTKLLRVVGKNTMPGGKISISFHDGKNLIADNHVKVGDSVLVSLPNAKVKPKFEHHLNLHKGATCLIYEGKHSGKIVKLKDIVVRKGSKPSEAIVHIVGGEDFITVAKYLFVVDEKFSLKGEHHGHA